MGGPGEALRHAVAAPAPGAGGPEAVAAAEVHREVPVVPAVVAAEGHLVAAGRGAGDADRLGHHLAAAPGVAHHVRPGVQLEQQLGQTDVLRRVEGAHRAGLHRVDDGLLHVRVGVAQRRGSDADHGEVEVAAPVEVPDLAARGAGVVRRPQVGQVHLGPLAEELRSAGQDLLRPRVQPLPGAVLEVLDAHRCVSLRQDAIRCAGAPTSVGSPAPRAKQLPVPRPRSPRQRAGSVPAAAPRPVPGGGWCGPPSPGPGRRR